LEKKETQKELATAWVEKKKRMNFGNIRGGKGWHLLR